MNSVGIVDGYPFCDSGLEFTGNGSEPSQPADADAKDPVPCKAVTSLFFTVVQDKIF